VQIGLAAAQVVTCTRAAEAIADRRHTPVGIEVPDDHDIGGQLGLVRGDEVTG
jgi:hypothetical protein